MLIGREREVRKLQELYEGDAAELVAIYGRRRVGKTYLVDDTFQGKITFRHAGLSPIDDRYDDETRRKSRMKDQLRHFARSLEIQHLGDSKKKPDSWLDAFCLLEDAMQRLDDGKTRQLVFLDEIQWMETPRSGFITAFEAFWNGWACHRPNLMVIVCGSSSSWILNKLIHNRGGLYGRVSCQIKLLPFTLNECERFFESKRVVLSRYDIAQAYMMVGGIPYYLKYFDRGMSLAQNMDHLFFSKDAPLENEFDDLFASLFVNAETMKKIVRALNTRRSGLTRQEVIKKTGITDSGEFSDHLKALVSGGFITLYRPYGVGKGEERYMLVDPFCLFYLRFVEGGKGRKINWVNMEDTPSVAVWRGLSFENLCFQHVDQIKSALGIRGVTTSESRWQQHAQEDIPGGQADMIIERRDHIVELGEIKFYNDLYCQTTREHLALVRRRNALLQLIPKRYAIHNLLITTYGLEKTVYANDFVQVITLDDLFAF